MKNPSNKHLFTWPYLHFLADQSSLPPSKRGTFFVGFLFEHNQIKILILESILSFKLVNASRTCQERTPPDDFNTSSPWKDCAYILK